MENLSFKALLIDGSNYLTWSLDAEAHLAAKNLHNAIFTDVGLNIQDKAKALVLIGHHLEEPLKTQHMNEMNPRVLWEELKLRYDHMQTISLPATRHNWINLRVQDHTTIANCNIKLF